MASISDYIVGNPQDYIQEYEPSGSVDAFRDLPRFSHTDNFSLIVSDDVETRQDYTLGLIFIACFVMSFFTVWGFLILLFKCIGPKNLGVFSGYPFKYAGAFATCGRITFIFSSVMVMIFSILVVTKGLAQLQETSDVIAATNEDVLKIHDEFVLLSDNLKVISRQASPVRDELVNFLKKDICPLTPASQTESDVRGIGFSTLASMEELSNFISDRLEEVDEGLAQTKEASEQTTVIVEKAEFTGAAAALTMIPYFLVPALLLVTLFMGWMDIYSEGYYCFTHYFSLPFFCLMVIFAYVAAGLVVMAVEANADFCAGGDSRTPVGTIENILAQYNLTEGSLYYDGIMFYANQCRMPSPFGFMEGYYDSLNNANSNLDAFADLVVQVTPEQLSQECGVEYGPTLQLVNQLQTYTTILIESTNRSLALMSCENIVPLYTASVYETTCQSNITAATWMFASYVTIAFFGMLMLMFRGAYYPIGILPGTKAKAYGTDDSDYSDDEDASNDGMESAESAESADVLSGEYTSEEADPDQAESNEEDTYDNATLEDEDYEYVAGPASNGEYTNEELTYTDTVTS